MAENKLNDNGKKKKEQGVRNSFWKHAFDFIPVGETVGYLKKEAKYDQDRTETHTVFVTTLM